MNSRTLKTHRSHPFRILHIFAVALACVAVTPASAYEDGQMIEITGTVTDSSGAPIPEISVVFNVSRRAFTVSKFGRATRDSVQLQTITDQEGQFSFDWRWLDYYNRFELQTGVPTRSTAGETFEVLGQLDLRDRIQQGSPVVASLVVDNTQFLNSLRDFLDSVDTEDKKRIYNEMGNPDRVQKTDYAEELEVSWWYFRSGKAYRFRDGKLDQVVHFDPITPFGPSTSD